MSSYVIPAERLERIKKIKSEERVLAVTTQCVEAGVDIDMDYVIRDFGPFDSIVQVAGRCNREGISETKNVEVVCLYDEEKRSNFFPTGAFCEMVYGRKSLVLDVTRSLLEGHKEIPEDEIYALAGQYFDDLRRSEDLGKERTKCLIDFSHEYGSGEKERRFDIRKELRGNLEQYSFVVENYAPCLREDIEALFADDKIDRWERRRKMKDLAGEIAKNSISVNAYNLDEPEDISERVGCFYFLNPKYYDDDIGFDYRGDSESKVIFI